MSFPPNTDSVELESFRQHILQKLSTCRSGTSDGTRLDGRRPDDTRRPVVTRNVVAGTVASVQYQCGETLLVSSVSCTMGPPVQPDAGRIIFSVSSPFAEDPNAIRLLEAFLTDSISMCFDTKTLCILPGEACWIVNVDIVLMALDGGLRAACLHAAALLFQELTLPQAKLPNSMYSVATTLKLSCVPHAATFAVLFSAEVILVDASAAEESVADALVTVVVDRSAPAAANILLVSHHGATQSVTPR